MLIFKTPAPTAEPDQDSTPTPTPTPETDKIQSIATDTEEQEIKGINVPGAPFLMEV
jgi:hypothetical protein